MCPEEKLLVALFGENNYKGSPVDVGIKFPNPETIGKLRNNGISYDAWESGERLIIMVDAQCRCMEQVSVYLEENRLTVELKALNKEVVYPRWVNKEEQKISFRLSSRVVAAIVNEKKISADVTNGLLEIEIQKVEIDKVSPEKVRILN